jgi:hypothetical protein
MNVQWQEAAMQGLGGRRAGLMLAGVWLILTGLIPHLNVTIDRSGDLLDILAVVAGVLILVDR